MAGGLVGFIAATILANNSIICKLEKIMADLTQLETEVSENLTVTQSAITLLNGLKAALDAAGTDPAKLKALSDSLSSQTDSLAAAVSANTPAEGQPTT